MSETRLTPSHAVFLTHLFSYITLLNGDATEAEALEQARKITSLFVRYIESELPLDTFIWSIGIDATLDELTGLLLRDSEESDDDEQESDGEE